MPVTTFRVSTCATGMYDECYALWLTLTDVFRYLVVLYYQANKAFEKLDAQKKEADLQKMKEKYNLNTPAR